MRCFLSINISPESLGNISKFMEEQQSDDFLEANFVKSNHLHLTMKFLGDINTQKTQEIKRILEQTKFKPFEISLKGLGGFPSNNYVKVLWIDVDNGNSELVRIWRDIDDKLSKIGFQKDKEHIPHLTIARVKFVRDKSKLYDLFDKNQDTTFGTFWCDKINFMQSELTPNGPIYSEI